VARTTQVLVRVFSPLLYVGAAYAVFLAADIATGLLCRSSPATYEWLTESVRGVEIVFVGVALPVLALVTVILLRLEGALRPTFWDHLRQSAFWYLFGFLYWWGLAEGGTRASLVDTLIALLPLTAIFANALTIGAARLRRVPA